MLYINTLNWLFVRTQNAKSQENVHGKQMEDKERVNVHGKPNCAMSDIDHCESGPDLKYWKEEECVPTHEDDAQIIQPKGLFAGKIDRQIGKRLCSTQRHLLEKREAALWQVEVCGLIVVD